MKFLYRLFQIIMAPFMLVVTVATCLFTIFGSLFNAHFWGYYPAMMWSKILCRGFLLPVKVEGRENIQKCQSYVFVANHQGPFDIFLIYGYLDRNFKWMMKKSLKNIPLVGKACESAGHIFVDKGGPKAIQQTYEHAKKVLQGGTSLVVFPEGARTFTGHMGIFRRGAFQLADELQLPVVPVTIDGSFTVLSRQQGFSFLTWHPLRMVIHAPIFPQSKGNDNIRLTMQESYEVIMNALPEEFQGFVENPDQ